MNDGRNFTKDLTDWKKFNNSKTLDISEAPQALMWDCW